MGQLPGGSPGDRGTGTGTGMGKVSPPGTSQGWTRGVLRAGAQE